jgi:hypothetical protein
MGRLLKRTRERPRCDREPDVSKLALERLGTRRWAAGSCVWHVVGLQRSVREWAIRQGWGGRPVRQEQAQGILIAALGMLARHFGYEKAA